MAVSPPFATTDDVRARHPSEAAALCADEASRRPDWTRFDAAMQDVSTEMRAILAARYSAEMLAGLDDDSNGVLKLFAVDMSMYRVALSFSRSTDQIKARYDNAVKRLEGIAAGRGALNPATPAPAFAGDLAASTPNEAIVLADRRDFTRRSLRDL